MADDVFTKVQLNFFKRSLQETTISLLLLCKDNLVNLGLASAAEVVGELALEITHPQEEPTTPLIRFRCFAEANGRLRIRIISDNYNHQANCSFPKTNNFRVEGREYTAPATSVHFSRGSRGTPFYIVDFDDIEIVENDGGEGTSLTIYEDEDEDECGICMDQEKEIVFSPCGHFYSCEGCTTKLFDEANGLCPICRQPILSTFKRDEIA